jgi:hypothetical protein
VEVETLVRSAQPKIYDNLEEIVYVFELARARGAYATALRFGHAILQAAPDHRLKGEIEKVINSKGFMMS